MAVHSKETYNIEIVHKNTEDGLVRPGMIKTEATGIRDLETLQELRWVFEHIIERMDPDAEIVVTRTIQFYCHSCRCLIGDKTMPLKIIPFRRHTGLEPNSKAFGINTEIHRCIACGHHTRYAIEDPILSVY